MKNTITLILLLVGSIYGVQAQSFDFNCEIVCIDNDGDGFTVCDEATLLSLEFVNLDFGDDVFGDVIQAFWGKRHTFQDGHKEEVIIAYDSYGPHYRIGSATRITQVSVDTLAEALVILSNY